MLSVELTDRDPYAEPNSISWDYGKTFLIVRHNKEIIISQSDGGEPEDQTFSRDWSWVKGAIEKAYNLGVQDGSKRSIKA